MVSRDAVPEVAAMADIMNMARNFNGKIRVDQRSYSSYLAGVMRGVDIAVSAVRHKFGEVDGEFIYNLKQKTRKSIWDSKENVNEILSKSDEEDVPESDISQKESEFGVPVYEEEGFI